MAKIIHNFMIGRTKKATSLIYSYIQSFERIVLPCSMPIPGGKYFARFRKNIPIGCKLELEFKGRISLEALYKPGCLLKVPVLHKLGLAAVRLPLLSSTSLNLSYKTDFFPLTSQSRKQISFQTLPFLPYCYVFRYIKMSS